MNIKEILINNNLDELNSIQGGKTEHIFNYNRDTGENLYLDEFREKEAKEAFENGIWTIKFHGSSGFITKENGELILWERRDIKDKKISQIKIDTRILTIDQINSNTNYTKAIQPALYNSGSKQHNYIFIEISRTSKKGKDLYCRIETLFSDVDIIYQSIEYVGKKIQGNEEQFNWNTLEKRHYGIVFHASVISEIEDKSFKSLKEMASTVKIEGWIIYHNNKAWKIRMNMLQNKSNCAFDDKEKTDILPFVY
jgi:hypothetical protein